MTDKGKKVFKESCRICGDAEWSVLYNGPIRVGKFGDWSKSDTIWKCSNCQAGFLNQAPLNYESPSYWNLVNGSSSPEDHYTLHDGEQINRLKILGTEKIRGKVIADIGCGAGSFVDLVKGYASKTIAVEPAQMFHQELRNKGHKTYSYCRDALKDWEGAIDISVSFDVIEHLENPLEFLKEIKLLLKTDGFLLLCTPNCQDWLIDFLPGVYDRFFFRQVHRWYFTGYSLEKLGSLAGFSKVNIKYIQKYDLSNALLWIRDHRPTGQGKTNVFRDLDTNYKMTREKQGRSDFIYALFER